MEQNDLIVITGAAGFIGSYLSGYLNSLGYHQLILVDDFSRQDKSANLQHKNFVQKVHRDQFFDWCLGKEATIKHIFHLGARTDTTEMDYEVHRILNVEYSKKIWQLCSTYNIPLVYASSAATYGNGELGYVDDEHIISSLKPLNPYGESKNNFDIWALQQNQTPPFWAGLKFFNVYGPNEYHKGRMASVILHAFNQIKNNGTVKLFRSHNPAYKDGEQIRDFIYVKDIVNMCVWHMQSNKQSGLYNAGTGNARTFLALVQAIFNALSLQERIEFVDTPLDIRDKYQYFTQADMHKLRHAGFTHQLYSLEDGVTEYVQQYLSSNNYY